MRTLSLLLVVHLAFTLSTTPITHSTSNTSEPKICGFNVVGPVPANKDHSYSLLQNKTSNFAPADFSVTFHEDKIKNHPFFSKIGEMADFKGSFSKMVCRITDKVNFARSCNITSDKARDQEYSTAFGEDIIFRCKVPDNHFVLDLRFVEKLGNLTSKPSTKWSIFGGLYPFKDEADAKNIILTKGQEVNSLLNSTKLDTFNIHNELNVLPDEIKAELADFFNKNSNSTYVKGVKPKEKEDLANQIYLGILKPGYHFMIGSIHNGTPNVKHFCDRHQIQYPDSENCGLDLKKK